MKACGYCNIPILFWNCYSYNCYYYYYSYFVYFIYLFCSNLFISHTNFVCTDIWCSYMSYYPNCCKLISCLHILFQFTLKHFYFFCLNLSESVYIVGTFYLAPLLLLLLFLYEIIIIIINSNHFARIRIVYFTILWFIFFLVDVNFYFVRF